MAQRRATPGNSLEAQGPSQGEASGALPSNPSDAIFQGRSLPLMTAQAQTMRRPFSEPTRPPLHYSDGAGPSEGVTSRRPAMTGPPGNVGAQIDHAELRPIQGVDKQPYSSGSNTGMTTNGVEIRGT